MWQCCMSAFLHGKGQIIWDKMENNSYVYRINFFALGSRDMHDANNKVVDYLFRSLCKTEFYRIQAEDLVCKIWEKLKNAHVGNNHVKARLFTTYRTEYTRISLISQVSS
jgi:hypothetical protein